MYAIFASVPKNNNDNEEYYEEKKDRGQNLVIFPFSLDNLYNKPLQERNTTKF